jgi:hypothetical protein
MVNGTFFLSLSRLFTNNLLIFIPVMFFVRTQVLYDYTHMRSRERKIYVLERERSREEIREDFLFLGQTNQHSNY